MWKVKFNTHTNKTNDNLVILTHKINKLIALTTFFKKCEKCKGGLHAWTKGVNWQPSLIIKTFYEFFLSFFIRLFWYFQLHYLFFTNIPLFILHLFSSINYKYYGSSYLVRPINYSIRFKISIVLVKKLGLKWMLFSVSNAIITFSFQLYHWINIIYTIFKVLFYL